MTGSKEASMKRVTISKRCLKAYPWIKFGYCLVKGLSVLHASVHLKEEQKATETYIRSNSER